MSGIYQCPRRGAQFSPESAAEWRYECTERGGCRADLSIVLARKAPATTRSVVI
jgi:hypothetical protein